MKKTSMGLDENVAGLLCYAFVWVSGLIFFFAEKESKYVRFHAMQSIVVFGALSVLNIILNNIPIPIVGGLLALLLWPVQVVLWVLMMYKGFKMEWFKLPIAGDIAEQQVNK